MYRQDRQTDGTDIYTDSGDTICLPPTHTENGEGIKTCSVILISIWGKRLLQIEYEAVLM